MGIMVKRISKTQYYTNIAREVSKRSPCLKMRVGTILVKNDVIISTGYNGPARGEPHCTTCVRLEKKTGSEYSVCPSVHSEENTIINAARQGISTIGSTMYLWTEKPSEPCYRCKRAIKNAGIKEIFVNGKYE